MAFKMKLGNSPLSKKGKLSNFFKGLGEEGTKKRQDAQKAKNEGGLTNFEKRQAAKKAARKGNIKPKAKVKKVETKSTKRQQTVSSKGNIKPKDKVEVKTKSTKGQEKTVSSKGDFFNFSGKKGDKFKYRIGPWKDDESHGQFQRPGSDVWESSKTKKGSRAIGDLFLEDYEGQNVEITPIQKRKTKIKKKK